MTRKEKERIDVINQINKLVEEILNKTNLKRVRYTNCLNIIPKLKRIAIKQKYLFADQRTNLKLELRITFINGVRYYPNFVKSQRKFDAFTTEQLNDFLIRLTVEYIDMI